MPPVVCDDDAQDARLQAPQQSSHWQSLNHHDEEDVHLLDQESLLQSFRRDLDTCEASDGASASIKHLLAIWSCILGYCEALATHKDPLKRYSVFPVPLSALKRLVQEEFVPLVTTAAESVKNDLKISLEKAQEIHRQRVQAISNAIWQQILPKANVRDEIHANSVYISLRGKSIDKKSLDCFGAAVTTIAGLQYLPELCGNDDNHEYRFRSFLTLSEDHAYERHEILQVDLNDPSPKSPNIRKGTCEVAVPGTSKLAKSKRGRDIALILRDNDGKSNTNTNVTPETSWLYMANNPTVCDSIPMTLVAVVCNLNPTIDTTLASGQLYDLKRDLLWILYDRCYMSKFPFAILELGDCEEHRESDRGRATVELSSLDFLNEYQIDATTSEPIIRNEELFLRAMHINLTAFDEAHVYPYFYAGHYHKDAGKCLKDPCNEYRLVEAMALYARAAFVASKYPYHAGCIQLNKHLTTAAMLIAQDMMTVVDGESNKTVPRAWKYAKNAIAFGTWLLGFFDSLLHWEETSGESTQFVEILSIPHRHFIGKLFALLPLEIRVQVLQKVSDAPLEPATKKTASRRPIHSLIRCMNHGSLSHFGPVRSKRLSSNGFLWNALAKPKISIPEVAMVIPTSSEEDGVRSCRRAKRYKTG
jgi:hypothetical protein